MVLGGVDATGSHLYTVYPHGSTDKLPYVSMGSGSLAAMAVLESGYREDLDEQSALNLVVGAIRAGIFNDLGSGNNVNICIIRANGEVTYTEGYQKPNEKSELVAKVHLPASAFKFPRGTTTIVSEKVTVFADEEANENIDLTSSLTAST